MAGTVKVVSLVDSLRWNEGEGDDRRVETFDNDGVGAKGVEVEIPSSEFDRLEAAGVVAKPRSDAAKAAKDAADTTPPVLPPVEEPSPDTVDEASAE